MRKFCQKLGCMVLLLLAALMRWQLSICGLGQNPLRLFRAGPIDHLLQLGDLGLEHLVFRL